MTNQELVNVYKRSILIAFLRSIKPRPIQVKISNNIQSFDDSYSIIYYDHPHLYTIKNNNKIINRWVIFPGGTCIAATYIY